VAYFTNLRHPLIYCFYARFITVKLHWLIHNWLQVQSRCSNNRPLRVLIIVQHGLLSAFPHLPLQPPCSHQCTSLYSDEASGMGLSGSNYDSTLRNPSYRQLECLVMDRKQKVSFPNALALLPRRRKRERGAERRPTNGSYEGFAACLYSLGLEKEEE